MLRLFMFHRSKTCTLIKRIWKALLLKDESSSSAQEDRNLKDKGRKLLGYLTEDQLEILASAIESKGAEMLDCVKFPVGDLNPKSSASSLAYLFCKLWRWPDITNATEIRCLGYCNSTKDYPCINPYHWSLVYQAERVGCIKRDSYEKFLPEDEAPSEAVSVATGGSKQSSLDPLCWCRLAYWENRTRVGTQFSVNKNNFSVFGNLLLGDGLCLADLAQSHPTSDQKIIRTREKIGLGLHLSLETDGVWLYNRSRDPMFVNSPTLEVPNSKSFLVHKVLPDYSIKVFDYDVSYRHQRVQSDASEGPYNPYAVRVSFAKGWGPRYSRQFITSCPCWLEILLVPPR